MEPSRKQHPQKLPILKYTRKREIETLSGVIYIQKKRKKKKKEKEKKKDIFILASIGLYNVIFPKQYVQPGRPSLRPPCGRNRDGHHT